MTLVSAGERRVQDLRFAIRQLLRYRGFASMAIAVPALGVAASVALFGFVDAAIIRPLPYAKPSRLVGAGLAHRRGAAGELCSSAPRCIRRSDRSPSQRIAGSTAQPRAVVTWSYNGEGSTMIRLASALFIAAVVTTTGQQPSAPSPVADVQTIGPQVGARVPSFTLTDQTGHARSLESLMGPKGAILVFFRSADW
jgi:hypothetical protein